MSKLPKWCRTLFPSVSRMEVWERARADARRDERPDVVMREALADIEPWYWDDYKRVFREQVEFVATLRRESGLMQLGRTNAGRDGVVELAGICRAEAVRLHAPTGATAFPSREEFNTFTQAVIRLCDAVAKQEEA